MKYLYCIHDRVAQEIVGMRMYAIMVFRTDKEAARYFADAINDETSVLHKHPGDYQLLHLGSVHEQTAEITPQPPTVIITGDALVATQQPTLVKEQA
jgi:hypothetical protein